MLYLHENHYYRSSIYIFMYSYNELLCEYLKSLKVTKIKQNELLHQRGQFGSEISIEDEMIMEKSMDSGYGSRSGRK